MPLSGIDCGAGCGRGAGSGAGSVAGSADCAGDGSSCSDAACFAFAISATISASSSICISPPANAAIRSSSSPPAGDTSLASSASLSLTFENTSISSACAGPVWLAIGKILSSLASVNTRISSSLAASMVKLSRVFLQVCIAIISTETPELSI